MVQMKFCVALATVSLLATLLTVSAHPLCLDDSSPSKQNQEALTFCTAIKNIAVNDKGACCNTAQEANVKATLYDTKKLSAACKPLQAQVACGECNPYAVHLFATGTGTAILCPDFCAKYVAACGADLKLPANFCDANASDDFYCYPMKDKLAASTTLTPYFKNLWGKLPEQPIGMFMRPGANVWWFVDQTGYIREIANDPDATTTTLILNIDSNVLTNGEMGLIGFVFSPDYETTKKFYCYYIDNGMNSVLSRFTYMGSADATRNTEQRILQFSQPYPNHNGGTLLFEPDAIFNPTGRDYYDLYISVGDGGSANDPNNGAQNLDSKFGKILKLRMSTDYNRNDYTYPPGNIRNEVFAYGLRNPWRCTFHRLKVDKPELWCGDVGQDYLEEIDLVVAGGNYGWRNYEGTRFNMGDKNINYIPPVFEYCHNNDPLPQCAGKTFTGQSITGGYWYTGTAQNDQYGGNYIFADYQQGSILRMYLGVDGKYGATKVADTGFRISALAEDNDGNLFILKTGDIGMAYQLPDLPTGQTPPTPYVPEPTNPPQPTAQPTQPGPVVPEMKCTSGVQNGNICCALECGACGGPGSECGWYNGGAGRCCTETIAQSNQYCSASQPPPCILMPPSKDIQSLIAEAQNDVLP